MEITASDQRKASLKLVGMPQPATVGDAQHSMGTGLASSEEAAALNTLAFPALSDGIAAAQPATIVVEELDAEDEDPFTLDSFESLIRAHTAAGKDFILARVITREDVPEGQAAMETGQPRIFTSIYQAHQANRILFRTQPEEGLLHRMVGS